jgi:hypothetical protein
MLKVVTLSALKSVYDIREIVENGYTLSVAELINELHNLPQDAKIVVSNDSGYTYGSIRPSILNVREIETYEEEEERERREEEEWEDSLPNEEDVNYVIVQDNGEPLKWSDDNKVVIYGGIVDAELDLQEGDKIVTLGEYAKSIGVDWRTLL